MTTRQTLIVAMLALASACAGARPALGPAAAPAAKASLPDSTTWVAKSTEYRALVIQR